MQRLAAKELLSMAWDASRPVPWKRLSIEWTVVAVVVAGLSYFVTHNRQLSSYITIVLAGAVYVGFGAILAKFGYARKTLTQLRAETAATQAASVATPGARPKPAPTSRTSTGSNQRSNKKKR
jgi:hypothetical protein